MIVYIRAFTEMKDKKPKYYYQPLDRADDTLSTGVVLSPEYDEYDEYLRLNEIFKGDRLQRLVRKLEYESMIVLLCTEN